MYLQYKGMIRDMKKELKGRGALSNPANRFDTRTSTTVDDGWWQEDTPNTIATVSMEILSRTIISTNRSPDIPFEQSINPYMGCEHGCIYCYARPSHAYWDLSPGIDFETRIFSKPNGPALLREALDKKAYQCKPISIGANTDPYQPLEKELLITRGILEVLREYKHPFSLITKSALVLRDLDILAEMARDELCSVAVSVTTLCNELKRKMEPRTASPRKRLRVISALSKAGIPVTLLVAPVIPFVNDSEIESIVRAGSEAGASTAQYIFLRLPLEIAQMMKEWLNEHYPQRANHVMSLVRQSRGGKEYDSTFGDRMTGKGVFADLISQRFHRCCREAGLSSDKRFSLNTSLFERPTPQQKLF